MRLRRNMRAPYLAVCLLELLQDDGSLPPIRGSPGEQFDALIGLESSRSFLGHLGSCLLGTCAVSMEVSFELVDCGVW